MSRNTATDLNAVQFYTEQWSAAAHNGNASVQGRKARRRRRVAGAQWEGYLSPQPTGGGSAELTQWVRGGNEFGSINCRQYFMNDNYYL